MKNLSKQIAKIVKNNFYIMKFAWKLCPKRIACEGIWRALNYFEWLFFSGVFMKKIIAMIEKKSSFDKIIFFVMLTVVVFFFVNLFNSWYDNCIKPQTDIDVYKGLYQKLYKKAQNADLSCFENSDFYDRYMMALEDADQRLLETINNIWAIVMGAVAVAVSWYMMFALDKWVILFVAAPLIGNFVFATALNKISYQIYEESVIFKRIADYVNRMVHLADYAKDVRLTGIFHVMQKKHTKSQEGITKVIDSYKKKSILYGWGYLFLTYSTIFEGVLFYGAYRTMVSKSMSLAEFTVLSSIMVAVSSVLIDFTQALLSSFKNSYFIENLRVFLEHKPQIPEDTDGIIPDEKIREIAFKNVSFHYRNGKPVLKDISFHIQEGKTCALVGFNGAGKTTIIKLLLRLYDPTDGEILVNGINIKDYNLKEYRKLFATAFQDGRIFARDIRENVWMREVPCVESEKKEIDAKVWEALELAGIRDLVEKLPDKLDTILTKEFADDGIVMSGGQYQKIVAARAFAADKPVLVFDEPSSALDPIAEYQLFHGIEKAKEGKILFFISHRLSSVQNAQEILLLRNGRIIERGTHKLLMREDGEYAKLYKMQAQNYSFFWNIRYGLAIIFVLRKRDMPLSIWLF